MSASRDHLVDRAVEALGGLDALAAPPRPRAPVGAAAAPDIRVSDLPVAERPETKRSADGAAPLPAPASPARETAAFARPSAPAVPLTALTAAGLVALPAAGRSRASEEVSVIQQGVLRALAASSPADPRSRVVLVTSARPGEGKSFVSLNLAATLATGGPRPVVLVDADGKRDSLDHLLGLADRPGLRALASETGRAPRALLVPTEIPGLSVLPYGAEVAGARDVPSGPALAAAARGIAAALPGHVVVLDTPPCLTTSDAGSLAEAAGQVLIVVEAERTGRREVEAALDLVDACPTLQLVLNRARLTESDTFGTDAGAYAAEVAR